MHIKELILSTQILNEQKNFYLKVLELDIWKETSNSFSVKTLETKITFIATDENTKPFYHFAFNIPENQFKESKEWASSKVELIKLNHEDEFDFYNWNAHSIYFYDPAGNIIELIARHNLKNHSQNKFSGKSLLNISEIGLPVYDVEKIFYDLKEAINIPLFDGNLKTFTAVGDDHGLFIIVPKGRKWFPDCPEAEIFSLTVKIISSEEREIEFENLPYKIIATKN